MTVQTKIKLDANSIPPPKKKRGRKRTKKRYFTEDTDLAIKEYLSTSDQIKRDHIFSTRIYYAFYKLAENLIHTFKFYYTEVDTLEDLKHKIHTAQIKAHLAVNREMLILYWQIGKTILDKQQQEGWGTKVTRRLSDDLRKAFPSMKGFSYTNLRYMQRFAEAYHDLLICQAPLVAN